MVAKQTKELATQSLRGAKSITLRADRKLAQLRSRKGFSQTLSLKEDSVLPLIRGLMGYEIKNLDDLHGVLLYARTLIGTPPKRNLWLPYLGETLDAGIAAFIGMEVLEFLNSLDASTGNPKAAFEEGVIEGEGKKLLGDGSVALVLGAADISKQAALLVQEIREKHNYVFMAGSSKNQTFAHQLEAENISLGWHTGLIHLGPKTSAIVHAFGFFVRLALSKGLRAGEAREILHFIKNKIFAFMMVLGEPDREKYASVAGAVSFGVQSVAKYYIPQLLPIYPLT